MVSVVVSVCVCVCGCVWHCSCFVSLHVYCFSCFFVICVSDFDFRHFFHDFSSCVFFHLFIFSKPRLEDMRIGKPDFHAPGEDFDDWDFTFNGYYSRRNKFELFRGFLELISRFEFEFCRR